MAEYLLQPDDSTSLAIDQADDFEAEADQDQGLVHADSLGWMRGQPGESFHFFATDAPFGFGTQYDGWKEPKTAEQHWRWLKPYWMEMVRLLVPGGAIIMRQCLARLQDFPSWLGDYGVVVECHVMRACRIWYPWIWWIKPGATPLISRASAQLWFQAPPDPEEDKLDHPCQMALSGALEIIRYHTLPGSRICDPFTGLGTIPLACKIINREAKQADPDAKDRTCVGIDQSAYYLRQAAARLEGCKVQE